MEEQELEKHFANIDCKHFTVFKRKIMGFWDFPLSGEEKENVLVEIIKSLLDKHPQLKEKLKLQ